MAILAVPVIVLSIASFPIAMLSPLDDVAEESAFAPRTVFR